LKILRKLLAFQSGTRAGVAAEPSSAVVANPKIGNMIDVAAYQYGRGQLDA
jgi:hypothetical protein